MIDGRVSKFAAQRGAGSIAVSKGSLGQLRLVGKRWVHSRNLRSSPCKSHRAMQSSKPCC